MGYNVNAAALARKSFYNYSNVRKPTTANYQKRRSTFGNDNTINPATFDNEKVTDNIRVSYYSNNRPYGLDFYDNKKSQFNNHNL